MISRAGIRLGFLFCGALLVARRLPAQETAPMVLRLPGAVRGHALGAAYVAGRGSDMVFHNPSQIVLSTGYAASFGRFGNAASYATLSTSTAVGAYTAGVGVQWLDFRADPLAFPTAPGLLSVADGDNASSLSATGAVARQVLGVRAGLAVRYAEERRTSGRTGRASVDLGLSRDVGFLTIGLSARHLGGTIGLGGVIADQPTQVTGGAMTRVVPLGVWFDLVVSGAVTWQRHRGILPGGGVEITYVPVSGWSVSGRVGARRVDGDGSPAQSPFTIGGGFGLDRFALDYAFEPVKGAGNIHRIGVRLLQ